MKSMFVTAILLLTLFGTAQASDTEGEIRQTKLGESRHCLQIKNIKNIEVVDNQTILFHTYQKEVWKNTLPAPCPGLKFQGGIQYWTSINRLCDLDIITVLNIGSTCQLGEFEKVEAGTGGEH
jgi:hypothetical protein